MNGPILPIQELMHLRPMLEPLVERFEVDDPGNGLVGLVPVVGGVFLHPLTRVAIQMLRVYGAGRDSIKILEPRFLRSLPRTQVAGVMHSSQLCARVAKALSEVLGELGQIRDQVASMGISLDLEYDMLRLSGKVDLRGVRIRVVAWKSGQIVVTGFGKSEIAGSVPRPDRTLILTGEPAADLDHLFMLVNALEQRFKAGVLDRLEQSLEIDVNEPSPAQPPAPVADPIEPAAPVLAAATPTPEGASGSSGVFELTETVEEARSPVPEQPAAPAQPEAAEPQMSLPAVAPEQPFRALGVRKIFEKLGRDTEISAYQGRLRLLVPMKVIQGNFIFYLEQRGPTAFAGLLLTPSGTRYPVEFDIDQILDLKEVFDRIVLGKV